MKEQTCQMKYKSPSVQNNILLVQQIMQRGTG